MSKEVSHVAYNFLTIESCCNFLQFLSSLGYHNAITYIRYIKKNKSLVDKVGIRVSHDKKSIDGYDIEYPTANGSSFCADAIINFDKRNDLNIKIGEYTATSKDGKILKVGCQELTFDKVEEIYESMKNLREKI